MKKSEIFSHKAPANIGPYSQGILLDKLIFCAGQIGVDPTNGSFVGDDIKLQTRAVLKNLSAVLEAAGSSFAQVLKTTVYHKNMSDFTQMNETYAEFFSKPFPARATIEVARLPKDALVEIECIAYKTDK